MKKQNDRIGWIDVLYVPATLVLSYVLARWIPTALAIALSAVLALLVSYLFEPRGASFKRVIFLILLTGIIIYGLQLFLNWPT